MLSLRSIVSRAPRSTPSLPFRSISTSPLLRSSAGYGDDPTEGASNSGTKTPANSQDPTPKGSTKGKTDTEVKPKSGGSEGSSGNKAKTTTGGSGDSGSTTGDKQPGGPEVSHSEEFDKSTDAVIGDESGGKAKQPGEVKKPGKPAEKK